MCIRSAAVGRFRNRRVLGPIRLLEVQPDRTIGSKPTPRLIESSTDREPGRRRSNGWIHRARRKRNGNLVRTSPVLAEMTNLDVVRSVAELRSHATVRAGSVVIVLREERLPRGVEVAVGISGPSSFDDHGSTRR